MALPTVYGSTIDEVAAQFGHEPALARPLAAARDVGLGYLVLRQPSHALSGGEAQRLKIAKELARPTRSSTLYVLDEPTVGQHVADVAVLAGVLQRLTDAGHTVVVVEHSPVLLARCDWLIELGPGGGPEGGRIVFEGPPSEMAAGRTTTAPYVRAELEGRA
jgi:excinuclease ABC subunit A